MRIAMLAALVASITAVPVWADWGPTKWGADRDATIAAIGAPAVAVKARKDLQVLKLDRLIKSTGTFEGIAVTQDFYFDKAGGLAAVRLEPKRTDCLAFVAAVRAQLGKPDEDTTKSTRILNTVVTGQNLRWNDQPGNLDKLLLAALFNNDPAPQLCQLLYVPAGAARTD